MGVVYVWVCAFFISRNAVNVAVRVTMPKSTTGVSCEPLSSGQRYEYKPQEKQFMWTIKKMQGGSTCECKIKVLHYELDHCTPCVVLEQHSTSMNIAVIPIYLSLCSCPDI